MPLTPFINIILLYSGNIFYYLKILLFSALKTISLSIPDFQTEKIIFEIKKWIGKEYKKING